eukprot:CAMPEP_0204903304 /NCGR_PEP_ID=MMETSP1397-20131031/4171_1 /ASSEMBLY_ACC=CAM_ASM_000891 /TAXON_ID=49980 /ORGANISM="Climacostomum Climacostomum virens, Strain Stock W-24" /LENGTH=449 /DNA_ID=CAMNT_0052071913 /DNA_START=3693 /DNA_END=5039 /DNA_ORIENTATION=-
MALHIEGSARIHRLKEVFLNPPQVFNRDMTMLVADTYARRLIAEAKKPIEGISVLEPLAGTGIRSIRYFKELTVPVVRLMTNDLSLDAVNHIKDNFELNGVTGEVTQRDACDLLYSHRNDQWNVIDLDPYGTVAPFLDSAIQAIKSGGLLCLTSTDMATLCGAHTETCFYKYGAVPTHDAHCHEFALRMILHSLNTAATRYQRVVVPLLSLSVDFYVRLFVKVIHSAKRSQDAILNPALVLQCEECPAFYLQHMGKKNPKGKNTINKWTAPTVCEECGSGLMLGGPIYSGPIHNKEFVDELLQSLEEHKLTQLATESRLKGVLTQVKEELEVPLVYSLPGICKFLKAPIPPQKAFKSAMRSLGFEVSQSHTSAKHYKTNAPTRVVLDVIKEWKVRQGSNPLKNIKEETAAWRILSRDAEHSTIDFEQAMTETDAGLHKVTRFPVLPANW